ncbi:MAG: phytanoyl-CoA dioxygenase family protein [Chloroflexota bacterium]
MRKLTQQEIQQYQQDGYIQVDDVFPVDELAEIDAEISRLREEKAARETDAHGTTSVDMKKNFMLRLGLRSPLTKAMCEDPRILALVEDVVQPGVAIYSAKMVEKPPFDEAICHWHQDDAYYRQNSDSDTRMSIWMPLQDTSEDMACLWVVPGSHKHGLQNFANMKTGICNLAFKDGTETIEGAVPCPVPAGSIILFHALTWHRSLANRTAHNRRSFIVSYQDALAVRGNKDQHKILVPARI